MYLHALLEMENFTRRNAGIEYWENFKKRNAAKKYWNFYMIMALRRNGTMLPMYFTNRNSVPVRSGPFRALLKCIHT